LLDYILLAASAFLAATILPLSSEIVVVTLAAQRPDQWGPILLVASVANTLGSCVNCALGRYLLHYQNRPWFPVSHQHLAKGHDWFGRYGQWSLLFAWAPIIGDALTVAAGVLRVHWVPFIVLVLLGKTARYGVVLVASQELLG
jgi:membrane protein YqaA with SNARE-associated domain